MLESLRRVGQDVGRGMTRAWGQLAEGWRELWSRSGGALTRFNDERGEDDMAAWEAVPRWAVLAGEVYENEREVVVRLEAPGLERDDFQLSVVGNALIVRGEKQHEREANTAHYYLRERAYGRFERVLPLPDEVDADKARAIYKNGVLTVRLPKRHSSSTRRIAVH